MKERQNIVVGGLFGAIVFLSLGLLMIPIIVVEETRLLGIVLLLLLIAYDVIMLILGWGRYINISSKGVWNKKYSYDCKDMKLTIFNSLAFGRSCAVAFGDRYYSRSDKGMIVRRGLCLGLNDERIAMIMLHYSDKIKFMEDLVPQRYPKIIECLIIHGAEFID